MRYCRNEMALNEISKFPKKSRILELGSNQGELLERLRRIGYKDCTGVDIAKPKYKVNHITHNLEDGLPKGMGKYDIIIMLETIEHLHNAYSTIKEIYNSLNEGGTLIISIPNHLKISNRIKMLMGKPIQALPPRPEVTHVWMWTMDEFREFLEGNNFEVKKVYPYLGEKAQIFSSFHKLMPNLFSSGFVFILNRERSV